MQSKPLSLARPDTRLSLPAYILIIGAMKSGTTTLFQHLASHPQICPSKIKEPSFFATDECWAMGAAWYESLFDFDSSRHVYALDGSTDYTKFPFCTGVCDRVASSTSAKIKMIYIMRHPLRRIESHAKWVAKTGREVWRNDSPRLDHSLDAGISPVSIAISRYAYQLEQYKSYYDRGDLLLLTLEELSLEPVNTLQRVFKYLDLDPSDKIADTGIMNKGSADKTSIHPLWSAAVKIPGLLPVVKTFIPNTVRDFLKEKTRVTKRVEGRYKLTGAEELTLLETLKDDLEKLQKTYNIDISRWWSIDI